MPLARLLQLAVRRQLPSDVGRLAAALLTQDSLPGLTWRCQAEQCRSFAQATTGGGGQRPAGGGRPKEPRQRGDEGQEPEPGQRPQQPTAAGSPHGSGEVGASPDREAPEQQQRQRRREEPEQAETAHTQQSGEAERTAAGSAPESQRGAGAELGADAEGQGAGAAQDPGELQQKLHSHLDFLKTLKGSSKVLKQTVGGKPRWWQALLDSWIGGWLEQVTKDLVRTRVETGFEVEEMLEGAKDAIWIVHKLMAEEDWESLRGMMGAKLLEAMRATSEEYRRAGLVWRTHVPADVSAALRGVALVQPPQIAELAPDQAAAEGPQVSLSTWPAGMFLVLTVQFSCDQLTTITRVEDGQVLAELTDSRPARWKFARGPLPKGLPLPQLDTPWFLLSI